MTRRGVFSRHAREKETAQAQTKSAPGARFANSSRHFASPPPPPATHPGHALHDRRCAAGKFSSKIRHIYNFRADVGEKRRSKGGPKEVPLRSRGMYPTLKSGSDFFGLVQPQNRRSGGAGRCVRCHRNIRHRRRMVLDHICRSGLAGGSLLPESNSPRCPRRPSPGG